MLAKVYRSRIEPPGEKPGDWLWYWTETDDLGESMGDPSEPYTSRQRAEEAARRAGYEVTVPARTRRAS